MNERERERNKGLKEKGEMQSARWMDRLKGRKEERMGWRDSNISLKPLKSGKR